MDVRFSEKRFFTACALVIAGLVVANLLALFFKYELRHDTVFGFVPMFEMNTEGNAPTYFSSFLLLFCAAISLYVWGRMSPGERGRLYWVVLALVLFAMSVDEYTEMHERLVAPTQEALGGTSGLLYYAWVIPMGIFTAAFALSYVPFLLRLPPRVRNLILLAGFTYVSGAIGVEVLGGAYDENNGRQNATYELIATVEETLEMLGLSLLATALMSYVARMFGGVNLRLRHTAMSRRGHRGRDYRPVGADTKSSWKHAGMATSSQRSSLE